MQPDARVTRQGTASPVEGATRAQVKALWTLFWLQFLRSICILPFSLTLTAYGESFPDSRWFTQAAYKLFMSNEVFLQ